MCDFTLGSTWTVTYCYWNSWYIIIIGLPWITLQQIADEILGIATDAEEESIGETEVHLGDVEARLFYAFIKERGDATHTEN